jgi:thiol:disulfide interchange protein DsbD
MALFPSLLKKLPRSGGWLNSVKVVMGFLELAAALKFLGNMDVALNPGNPLIFTYESVLCAWIALSVACGLYLLGVFRLPHDSPVTSIGVPRMVLASIFLGLALYMVPALFRKVPQGIIGEGIASFLPLDTSEQAGGGAAVAEGHLDWKLDYRTAWEQATKEGKPIFLDFTGVNCTNCRANEKGVFPRKDVREELEKFVRVQLYTDSVPRPGLSKADAEAEAERNRALQERMFEDVSTPLYAVIYPDKSGPFDGDKLSGHVADPGRRVYKGVIRDPADFVNYLRSARKGQVALAGR